MSSPDLEPEIVVVGAGGFVGRRVVAALAAAGAKVVACGRRGLEVPGVPGFESAPERVRIADAQDRAALVRALAGARVVVNAASPLRETAARVVEAALEVGAHYVDVGGEQAVLRSLYERYESAVRKAGLVALPGAGLDCLLGDLAVAWAAQHVVAGDRVGGDGDAGNGGNGGGNGSGGDAGAGGGDAGAGGGADAPAVRTAPAPRLADARPFDEISVTYAFDDLALTPGTQRAWFGVLGERPFLWRRDRWEPARPGELRRVNAGPDFGGERAAIAHAGGDAITIPRHVGARLVGTYLSTTRRPGASSALRLLSLALPLLPRAASDVLVPYADPSADYTRTRFAVIAQVRRSFASAQITIRGADPYRTTAVAAAWAARALASRASGPVGMRAPGELFRGAPALRELAALADLAIEPSFG